MIGPVSKVSASPSASQLNSAKVFLSYTTQWQAFALPQVCTHVHLKLQKKRRCTGCRRRRHFLMEEFWLTINTICLCVKSLYKCVFIATIELCIKSAGTFSFVCFTFKWSQVAYHPLYTLLHLLLTSFISSASIWMSLWCETDCFLSHQGRDSVV